MGVQLFVGEGGKTHVEKISAVFHNLGFPFLRPFLKVLTENIGAYGLDHFLNLRTDRGHNSNEQSQQPDRWRASILAARRDDPDIGPPADDFAIGLEGKSEILRA